MGLPIRGVHNLDEAGALGPANRRQDFCALALGARRTGFLGMGGFGLFADLALLLRRGLSFALGSFLALGRALLQGGALLRGGLLRRNVRTLFRNTDGVFGNSGFCVRYGDESFLRLVGASRFITLVRRKGKGKVAVSATSLEEANGWRWRCGDFGEPPRSRFAANYRMLVRGGFRDRLRLPL